jgi:hypothetical protein
MAALPLPVLLTLTSELVFALSLTVLYFHRFSFPLAPAKGHHEVTVSLQGKVGCPATPHGGFWAGGGGGILLLILDLGTGWGRVVSVTHPRFTLGERTPGTH